MLFRGVKRSETSRSESKQGIEARKRNRKRKKRNKKKKEGRKKRMKKRMNERNFYERTLAFVVEASIKKKEIPREGKGRQRKG